MPDELKLVVTEHATVTTEGALAYAIEHCENGASPLPIECRFALASLSGRVQQLLRAEEDAWGLVNTKSTEISARDARIDVLEAAIVSAMRLIATERSNEALSVLSNGKRMAHELLTPEEQSFQKFVLEKLGERGHEHMHLELLQTSTKELVAIVRRHCGSLSELLWKQLLPSIELCEALLASIEAHR